MNPEDISKILDDLTERLGPAGQYAWNILVNGERLMGVVQIVVAVILGVATFGAYRFIKHLRASRSDELGIMGVGALGLLTGGFALLFFGYGLASLLVPEFIVLNRMLPN